MIRGPYFKTWRVRNYGNNWFYCSWKPQPGNLFWWSTKCNSLKINNCSNRLFRKFTVCKIVWPPQKVKLSKIGEILTAGSWVIIVWLWLFEYDCPTLTANFFLTKTQSQYNLWPKMHWSFLHEKLKLGAITVK